MRMVNRIAESTSGTLLVGGMLMLMTGSLLARNCSAELSRNVPELGVTIVMLGTF